MFVRQDRGGFLLSGQGTGVSAFGAAVDTRAAANYGFLEFVTYSPSAVLLFQASHDTTAWFTITGMTATTTTATAQITGYFPYVRGAYSTGWAATASANMFYQPGIT